MLLEGSTRLLANRLLNCLPDEAEITIVIKDTDGAPLVPSPLFLSICPITSNAASDRRREGLKTIEEKMEDVVREGGHDRMMDTAAQGHRVHPVLTQRPVRPLPDEGFIQMRDAGALENKLGGCK